MCIRDRPYANWTPDFNTLKVQIDLEASPATPEDTKGSYRVTIPYTNAAGQRDEHREMVDAESPEEAKQQGIELSKGTFFTRFNNVTPNFQEADVMSLDAAWMR